MQMHVYHVLCLDYVGIVQDQRQDTAHFRIVQHTIGASTEHLHTVWKVLHYISLWSYTASYNNFYAYISMEHQPRLSQLFSLAGKKMREGLVSEVTWQMLAKWCCASLAAKRQFQTCLASLVDQTYLCEASKDSTFLADSQCSLLFHQYRAWALENCAHPHTIFMICHPSYPTTWAYVMHMTLDTRLPLFSCAFVEKIGEPGDEANGAQYQDSRS